jgi:hypothetical protein
MSTTSLRRVLSGDVIALAIVGAIAASSCSNDRGGTRTGDSGGSTGAGGSNGTGGSMATGSIATGGSLGTGGSMDPPIPAGDCRWEGYGIGSDGQSQCDTNHLLTHAAAQCSGAGGTIDTIDRFRKIVADCPTEAAEVQVYCCYADGLPAASDTPIALSSGSMTGRLAPAPGEDPARAAVLARAAASCVVGDWNALYAPDGVSVDMLRFGCR